MNYNDIISALNGLMPILGSYGSLYGNQLANFGQFSPILNYAAGVNASNNQYNLGTAQLQAEREQNLRTYGLALTNQELAAKQWQQQFGEGSRQFDVTNAFQNRALDINAQNAANQLAWEKENTANQLAWAKENAGKSMDLQRWIYGQQAGQNNAGLAEQAREFDAGQNFDRMKLFASLPDYLAQNAGWQKLSNGSWINPSSAHGNVGASNNPISLLTGRGYFQDSTGTWRAPGESWTGGAPTGMPSFAGGRMTATMG